MNASSSLQGWSSRLAIAVFFLVAAIISGCSSGVGVGGTGSSSADNIAQSSLSRDTNPQVPDADLAAVVAGNTAFALKVFPLLDTAPASNTFFSPYSITQAFALLAPGTRGTTLSEIEQTLAFSLSQDLLNPAFNKLDLLIASKATGAILANGLQTPQLNKANAVWAQQGFSILPAYLDTLAVNYGAGLHLVDFVNATEISRQTINDWVAGQTNDKIQDLIPQGGVSSATRLVLTNAIWFKANWASQFSQSATSNRPFTNSDGSSSSVPFMRQVFTLPHAQVAGCQAVDIPYAGDSLSMLVIMPDPGTFDAFQTAMTPAVVGEITNNLAARAIDLSLPKFTFTKASDLKSILKTLGMTAPFEPSLADLSEIDGKRDLNVSDVFHKAFVSVDEGGTEAAAATAITITTTTSIGTPPPALTLTIDHPFIFLVRDRQTGLILFMGKVVTL